jgi:hypothetical protein
MSVTDIVFLVDKAKLNATYAGAVPSRYRDISGMTDLPYETLSDLGATFGENYANLGYLTEADALRIGIPAARIAELKEGAFELEWNRLDDIRAELIQAQRWRIDRFNDQTQLGLPPTEDISPVLQYCQDIRDLPTKYPNPFAIVWPAIPA